MRLPRRWRGARDLDDVKKDIRLPAKSAQFRVEMRLLARTLELVARFQAWAARVTVVAVARCCMFIWDMFVTSFFMQIGLALPMIVYFHRTSISGLTANAIIVPLLGRGGAAGIPCDRAEFADTRALCARGC